jgi:sigma-B regulation protein RsbU (phosphoserine phosphatase)
MLNVLPLDQEHVGMYVLDVSGHGVPAALLAVSICRSLSCHQDDSSVLWRRAGESGDYEPLSPSAVVRSLNARVLGQSQTEQFFTLFYGILNHRTGEFRYAVAGHPAPVLLSADDEVTLLPGSGFPVGIIETDFEEERLVLAPGDRLLFYSDGVTESMNSAGELFGDDRLLETLRDAAPDSTLEALLAAALDDSAAWRGEAPIQDDLYLLALEYAPQPSSVPGPVTAPAKCSSVVPVTTLSAGAGWRS